MANQMKRNVKDSVFTTLFKIPKYSLDMYKTLHPEDTTVTEKDITIMTIENILVTGMFNDLGFLVKNNFLILVEAQSTFSVKLSIRLFLYLAETLKKYIEKMEIDLYSDSKAIGYEKKIVLPDGSIRREDPFYYLPTPELYVIYTGDNDVPDELDISDLYLPKPDGTKPLSLKVKILKSGDKNDYITQYIKFCKAANKMREKYPNDLNTAVQELVEYCINNNILSEFVKEHRDEVYDMMDVLFNQDYVTQVHENNLLWQGYNQGKEEAKEEIQRAKDETQRAKDETQRAKDETQRAKDEGREKMVKSIKIIMSVQNTSAEQVMDQLDIDEAEREIIRKMMD